MKFQLLEKPRALSLTSFSWDDNSYSRLFKACGGSDGFIDVWMKDQNSTITNDEAVGAGISEPTVQEDVSGTSSMSLEETNRLARKRQPSKLPSLVPVTKSARVDRESCVEDEDNGAEIDDREIEKYFIGQLI